MAQMERISVPEPSDLEIRITVLAGALAAPIYRAYVERLGLRGDERVLDFGTGSGNPARYLARILQRGGGQLTCVDVSERWMAVARRRLRNFANIDFKLGEIASLGLPDAGYDVVFIHFVLHDIPAGERPAIAAALARTLRPGGRLFVREPLRFIAQEELAGLMRGAGLAQVSAASANVFTQGLVYEGIFRHDTPAS
jgi:ubiquinone/menaquinone biosynthesis C-methylase UbiE